MALLSAAALAPGHEAKMHQGDVVKKPKIAEVQMRRGGTGLRTGKPKIIEAQL